MGQDFRAVVDGHSIQCPICGSDRFRTKVFRVAGSWLQTFDLEGFGREGIMLICTQCSRIQHFAESDAVDLVE
jgi:predicted nucleic-acid-binding Zn-ribbon protein